MLASDDGAAETGSNHPLANRMAVIAFLTNNITIGALFGSFSVLLSAVETRLGVGRELSTLSIPAVNLAMALSAPFVGVLAARFSIRGLMIFGTLLSTLGFALLAATATYPLYIAAYALFIGPGMAIGVIMPATLVTRWFHVGRGRALGIVSMPLVIAVVPPLTAFTLQKFGVTGAYVMLSGMSAISLVANFFTHDSPPQEEAGPSTDAMKAAQDKAGTMSVGALVRQPRFWALAIAAVSSNTGSIILTTSMVPMAATWGYSASLAALLLSIQALVGIAGTILFGWIADKIGAVRALAFVVFDAGVLWLLLLLHPPFILLLPLIGLIGLHGAGVLPVLSLVLGQAFGRENFSRAYGISNLFNLPFSVLCVPLVSIAYTHTGSYSPAIIGQAVFFFIATLLALSCRPRAPRVALA